MPERKGKFVNIIDLTYTLDKDIPVWPGTPEPRIGTLCSYTKEGFKETTLSITSHMGTHMDAPSHLFAKGKTLEQFPAEHFMGKAVVIDCTGMEEGEHITCKYIEPVREQVDAADFLLFRTGWEKFWGEKEYIRRSPGLDPETAKYIARAGKKGVGIDTMSIDAAEARELPAHKVLLGTNQMVIIENLCRLEELGDGLVDFIALPMKYQCADGAPVRAMACSDGIFSI